MRHFFKTALIAASLTLSFVPSFSVAQAAELLMFEHVGCVVCKKFKAEMLPKYVKSKYAKLMPMRSIVADDAEPYKGLELRGHPFIYSPTFILVQDGKELVRIRGFAGEAMFWQQMANIYANHYDEIKS